jgi:hypothetical protein
MLKIHRTTTKNYSIGADFRITSLIHLINITQQSQGITLFTYKTSTD